MVDSFPFITTVFICRSSILSCGIFVARIWCINSMHARTGHIILSPILSFDFWCVIISSLTYLFCHSNVIETEVAEVLSVESCWMNFFCLWNLIFLKHTTFVHLSPFASEYSQDCIQKKKARTWSRAMVLSCGLAKGD